LVFVWLGQFAVVLKDMFGKVIKAVVFYPPMHFFIDKTDVQPNFNNNPLPFTANLSYCHNNNNFTVEMAKRLTGYDVTKGFLVGGFC